LADKLDLVNYTIYPADTLMSQNPIPYLFESEQEVQKYVDLAKNETRDSLLERILAQYRLYINAKESTTIVLAADTLYSYFQNEFGTTHYNIFVGESGSGKNSALLVLRMLGYRPFYVTSVTPANYYTFLGDVQEGQGIILEDEADDISKIPVKKNILKTGYCSGGNVPKVGFKDNGNRYQDSYLTYCFKCFAMEELPGDKSNRGIFDRSFIHYFFKGNVPHNIKDIINDKESDLYKNLIHLRKLLFAFKLVNYGLKFPEIKTNLTARDAELTYPLLRMFYGYRNFKKIKEALSEMISERTTKKNNSIESKITETLIILGNTENNRNRNIIVFTNEEFETTFKYVAETKDNSFDVVGSTFYLPDGTKISKYKISSLLTSKFNAKPDRKNKSRGYIVNRADVEKISKQYQVIEDILIYEDKSSVKKVTEVTEVTEFKDATPFFSSNSDIENKDENKVQTDTDEKSETNIRKYDDHYDKSNENTPENKLRSDNDNDDSNNKINKAEKKEFLVFDQDLELQPEEIDKISPTTPLNRVTSVTNVTATSPQYPCFFCGNDYKTHIDFDMGNHFVEKHKNELNQLPISGNRETKIEWLISETKRRLSENSDDEQQENEDRRY